MKKKILYIYKNHLNLSTQSSQAISNALQDIATGFQPINQNVLDVVAAAAGETDRVELESEIAPVTVAKKRGRPPKSATQPSTQPSSSHPSIQATALTQPITRNCNLRSRKN